MLNNWLELNMIVNSKEQEIICSYFNRYTLGNQIDNNHIKMYFNCNDKNNIIKIINQYECCNSNAILILAGILDLDKQDILGCLKKTFIDSIEQQDEWVSIVVKRK